MARAILDHVLLDATGIVRASVSVWVYEYGTSTPIAQTMYSAQSGGIVKANPLTSDAEGRITAYVDTAQRVTVVPTGDAGITSTFEPDPAVLMTLAGNETVTGTKTNMPLTTPTITTPTFVGTSTYPTSGKIVTALAAEAAPVYYGGEGSDWTRLMMAEGTTATPSTSEHPMFRLYRILTPNTTVGGIDSLGDGHLFPNVEIQTRLTGAVAATANDINGGRYHNVNFVSTIISNATDNEHSMFAGQFHATAESDHVNANGINILTYTKAKGGQCAEFDLLNNGSGTAGVVPAWTEQQISPSVAGTTSLNLHGEAGGTSQVNTITITDGAGGDTFTITVVATVWTGAAINGTTAAIAWNASAAAVSAAIHLITNVPAVSVTVTGNGTTLDPYILTWGGHLEHTALTVTSTGTGCTATAATTTAGAFTGRFNETAILIAAQGVTQGHRAGIKFLPGGVADGGYALDCSVISGAYGGGVVYAARGLRNPNNGAIWWVNAAGNASLAGIVMDAGDQMCLRATAGSVISSDGGTLTYGVFNSNGLAVGNQSDAAAIRPIITLREIVTAKAGIGLDASDNFVILNGALDAAALTVAQETRTVTINQGGADTHALEFENTDVAHGVTTLAATNVYGAFRKESDANGGVRALGFADTGSTGFRVVAVAPTDDTTKTTAGVGGIVLSAFKTNGTGTQLVGADGNLAVIQNNATTRFIFDAEGSAHGDVEFVAFDDRDDLEALDALTHEFARRRSPEHALVTHGFGQWLSDQRDALGRAGVVSFYDDGPRAMVNFSRLSMLQAGALRQLGARLARLEQHLGLEAGYAPKLLEIT